MIEMIEIWESDQEPSYSQPHLLNFMLSDDTPSLEYGGPLFLWQPAGRLRAPQRRFLYAPRRYHPESRRIMLTSARRIHRPSLQPRPYQRPHPLPPLRPRPRPQLRPRTRPEQRRPFSLHIRNLPTQPPQCAVMHNHDIRRVMTAAVGKLNRGTSIPYITKWISRARVERCSKCVSGRCVFDHNRVTVLATMAPLCKSGDCVCGVERYGTQRSCKIIGWTNPRRPAYNIEIECDGRKIESEEQIIISNAGHLPQRPTATIRPNKTKTMTTRPRTTASTTTTTLVTTTTQRAEAKNNAAARAELSSVISKPRGAPMPGALFSNNLEVKKWNGKFHPI